MIKPLVNCQIITLFDIIVAESPRPIVIIVLHPAQSPQLSSREHLNYWSQCDAAAILV